MAKRKRLIPFKFLPASWGLSGKTKEIAQAEYELTGYDLDVALAEINHEKDSLEFKLAKAEIDNKYGKFSSVNEYEKHVATLKNEPWVTVVRFEMADPKQPVSSGGYFELDWNDAFVNALRENGYTGITSDVIVQSWFETLCKTIAMENNMGDTNEEIKIRAMDLPNGRKEYR